MPTYRIMFIFFCTGRKQLRFRAIFLFGNTHIFQELSFNLKCLNLFPQQLVIQKHVEQQEMILNVHIFWEV
jgi:hypothetical protein